MNLPIKDYNLLESIREKIINNSATTQDINSFLRILKKSGNENQVNKYLENTGFSSKEELIQGIESGQNNDLIKGLAIIGGAVMIAWLLNKK